MVRLVRSVRHGVALGVLGVVVALAVSGCSWFGNDDDKATSIAVFDAKIGDCFLAPEDIAVEVTHLSRVTCATPHQQESYALPTYIDPGTAKTAKTFPGDAALKSFADGKCAEKFQDYVGVDYRDSSLYFTYLVPSARSWQQDDDRKVICFVTTTGQTLTKSVKHSDM
ncbi:septum formation family protein [Cellulomonas sp. URHD0024]|uniref:septum formation family protein n=1 Tax=Cellulomonas sp. URHD0024 TaxID=1302620 RepID=UPI000411B183|nr:septum formation family protein [Cellulomonas sp. URHD0024]